MSVATAAKTEYFKRPSSFFKEGLTSLAEAIAGKIYSFSCGKKKSRCRASYNNFAEDFGASRRQVMRTVQALMDEGYIEQHFEDGKKTPEYRYIKPVKENTVVYTPMFFYERFFNFVYKKTGIVFQRKLSRIEADVLSMICFFSLGPSKGFDGSIRGLAKQVGVSAPSVDRAVNALMHGRLIYRPKKAIGRIGKTRYVADSAILREYKEVCRIRSAEEKETKKAASKDQEAYINAVNAKAERENFYAHRQAIIRQRIDANEAKARKSAAFVKVDGILKNMPLRLAKAEMFEPERLPELQQQEAIFKAQRNRILMQLGLREEDLQPQYICPKCADKGWLPDGRACDCYKPHNN